MGEVLRLTKDKGMDVEKVSFTPEHLVDLIQMVEKKEVSAQNAKKVFEKVFEEDIDPVSYIEEHGLKIVEDTGLLNDTLQKILEENPGPLEELLGGKEKVFGFFVGKMMRELKGKASPDAVREALVKEVEKEKSVNYRRINIMVTVNKNYLKLPGSYLFLQLQKVAAYQEANPDVQIVRLGIGDVTQPLAPAIIDALHKSVDEMAHAETFHGYAPDLGYEFLRSAIAKMIMRHAAARSVRMKSLYLTVQRVIPEIFRKFLVQRTKLQSAIRYILYM